MKSKWTILLACLFTLVIVSSTAYGKATKVADAIWAFDELYGVVLTPTVFMSPPLQSTDIIYNFSMSGLMGQRSVAETAPGHRDYNGGRWNVIMVSYTAQGLATFDGDGDGNVDFEITNAEDLLQYEASGDLMLTAANFFFECPLIPSH